MEMDCGGSYRSKDQIIADLDFENTKLKQKINRMKCCANCLYQHENCRHCNQCEDESHWKWEWEG